MNKVSKIIDPNNVSILNQDVKEQVIQVLARQIGYLEQSFAQMVRHEQMIALSVDVCKLSLSLVFKILVEKGIVLEEDLNNLYKTDVADKIVELQQQFASQVADQEGCRVAGEETCECTECDKGCHKVEPEDLPGDSDVVLPSERGEKITF
jgi:hypothetical protein